MARLPNDAIFNEIQASKVYSIDFLTIENHHQEVDTVDLDEIH